MNFNQYLEKKKQQVVGKQTEILHFAIDTLYHNSPHIGDPDSPWAEGEYEINHKVSINGQGTSPHHPPISKGSHAFEQATQQGEDFYESIISGPDPERAKLEFKKMTGLDFDQIPAAIMKENVSLAFLALEKQKLKQIQCGDNVKISNDTAHATDVEDGGEHWRDKPNGYGTYRKTKRAIKAKYSDVIK